MDANDSVETFDYTGPNASHSKFRAQMSNEKMLFMLLHIDRQGLMAGLEASITHPSHLDENGLGIVGIAANAAEIGEHVEGIFVSQNEAKQVFQNPEPFFIQVWRKMFVECHRIFETYLIELYIEVCRKDTRHLKSNRTVTMADVLQAMQDNTIIEVLTEKMAIVLSNAKLQDVIKEFGEIGLPLIPNSLNGSPLDDTTRTNMQRTLAFIWATRNIIQHNDGRVNELFLQNYPQSGLHVGQALNIDLLTISRVVTLIEQVANDLNRRAVDKYGL